MGIENLVPTCTEVFENARSDGANTSIEDIHIDQGYWRATETSRVILPCYNADACLGGVTGEADFCLEGYYGPCKTILKLDGRASAHKRARKGGYSSKLCEEGAFAATHVCLYFGVFEPPPYPCSLNIYSGARR